ncbi:hypothetical protein EP01_18120 [Bdellovibrio bacteriovorus]|nr:hypothetical protein EP01_18120 [Bdellovibrio bacteriovorus]
MFWKANIKTRKQATSAQDRAQRLIQAIRARIHTHIQIHVQTHQLRTRIPIQARAQALNTSLANPGTTIIKSATSTRTEFTL